MYTKMKDLKRVRHSLTLFAFIAAVFVWAGNPQTCCAKTKSTGIDYTVGIEGNYNQTEARKVLKLLNEFRTGEDAWCWSSSGEVVQCGGLGALVYDYDLEKTAMQRAAEAALSFSHTRPNGTSCFTAYNWTITCGECLAAGFNSAEAAFEGWCEANEDYSGQAHRRAMLNSVYVTVGIGYYECNGVGYWAMELGGKAIETLKRNIVSEEKTLTSVDVSSTQIEEKVVTCSSGSVITLDLYESCELPDITAKLKTSATFLSELREVDVGTTWILKGVGSAKLKGDKIVAGSSSGTVLLTTTALGRTLTFIIVVGDGRSSSTEATEFEEKSPEIKKIAGKTVWYQGKLWMPKLTVKWKKVDDALSYEVQVSCKKDFSNAITFETDESSLITYKLKVGKTYYVRIRAIGEQYEVDGAGYSTETLTGAWSSKEKVTIVNTSF